jgi:hypothetical protein
MANSIDFADACSRSSCGVCKVLSRSLSANFDWDAALRGSRSVSIAGKCQLSVSKVPGWVYSCFIQSAVFMTRLNRIYWVTKIARCNSSSETSPASFLIAKVPVPSERNSTPKPRCIAWRAVVSQHIWVM